MTKLLDGIEGVVCLMDDVLVHGKTLEEHNDRLHRVLSWLEESGMTLNKDKCTFSSTEVKFLGQILSDKGICSDPDKITAIQKIPEPTNVPELRRFLGMVNQIICPSSHLIWQKKQNLYMTYSPQKLTGTGIPHGKKLSLE